MTGRKTRLQQQTTAEKTRNKAAPSFYGSVRALPPTAKSFQASLQTLLFSLHESYYIQAQKLGSPPSFHGRAVVYLGKSETRLSRSDVSSNSSFERRLPFGLNKLGSAKEAQSAWWHCDGGASDKQYQVTTYATGALHLLTTAGRVLST